MTTPMRDDRAHPEPSVRARWVVWLAGLVVALGAGIATAHGLYQVALAAGTPKPLAWLYPLITDGLALVAYATTTRLADHGRRYAWTVVVTAAGLSGLTQASYLAGSVATAPPALRFAIGAWPAIAAAIVAHLLFLLGTGQQGTTPPAAAPLGDPAPPALPVPTPASTDSLRPTDSTAAVADPNTPHPAVHAGVQHHPVDLHRPSNRQPVEQAFEHPKIPAGPPVVRGTATRDAAPARLRAHTAATGHATRHGQLPTVSELMALAQVARGTAAAALKDLRQQPTQPNQPQTPSSTDEQKTRR